MKIPYSDIQKLKIFSASVMEHSHNIMFIDHSHSLNAVDDKFHLNATESQLEQLSSILKEMTRIVDSNLIVAKSEKENV